MLVDKSVRDLLSAFSSSAPTPGGGSAAALASAMGASLLTMVAGMPKTRNNTDEDRTALHGAVTSLTGLLQQLTEAVDADTAAYDRVVAAYKLPKSSPEEQQARKGEIQRALRSAIDVPLGVMRLSVQALSHAAAVAAHGNRSAASDVGVAEALLRAGATGAQLNVEINLEGIADEAYRRAVAREIADFRAQIDDLIRRSNSVISI